MHDSNSTKTINAAKHLLKHASSSPAKTAIYCESRDISYSDLVILTNNYSSLLNKLGLKEQDRVVILLEDSEHLVAAFLAVLNKGGIAVLANTYARFELLAHIIDDSQPTLIISNNRHSTDVSKLLEMHPVKTINIDEVMTEESAFSELQDTVYCPRETAALILYTSGSTGKPKGVVHSHENIINVAANFPCQILVASSKDIFFSTSKSFFAYGLGNNIIFPLSCGATTVLTPGRITVDIIKEQLDNYPVSLFFSVPVLYQKLVASSEVTQSLFKETRLAISAGEYLPQKLYLKWQEKISIPLIDGLGTTETLHIFISNAKNEVVPGSSGKPINNYHVKLNSETESESETETGKLQVKGNTLALCYWPDINLNVNSEGFYETGDVYSKTEENYTYLGRENDTFKSSGLWVNPTEIEETLLLHDEIVEAAVTMMQDEDGICNAIAFVVLKESHPEKYNEAFQLKITQFLEQKISSYKIPKVIEIVDNLPRTDTGKIQRSKLHLLYLKP